MGIEKVRALFLEHGLEDRMIEFEKGASATVALAAKALSCTEDEIAKSIAMSDGKGGAVLIVASGNARIDNKKFRIQFQTKAKMLRPNEVEELVGYKVGGVCPFLVNDAVTIYLDESLQKHAVVYPACGTANSAAKLSLGELSTLAKSKEWIDVTKE